jgi:hypothetical protein
MDRAVTFYLYKATIVEGVSEMKKNLKNVKPNKRTLKLSTNVKAGAYIGLGLNLGAGRGKTTT